MNVFEVAECEWVAAETAQEAVEFYKEQVGEDTYDEMAEEFGPPVLLTDEWLHQYEFSSEDAAEPISFYDRLAQLVVAGEPFPQFFASGNL